MEVTDGDNELSKVNPRSLLAENLLFPKVSEEFAAVQVIYHEVELRLRLKGVVEADDVGVFDLLEDGPLSCKFWGGE